MTGKKLWANFACLTWWEDEWMSEGIHLPKEL